VQKKLISTLFPGCEWLVDYGSHAERLACDNQYISRGKKEVCGVPDKEK